MWWRTCCACCSLHHVWPLLWHCCFLSFVQVWRESRWRRSMTWPSPWKGQRFCTLHSLACGPNIFFLICPFVAPMGIVCKNNCGIFRGCATSPVQIVVTMLGQKHIKVFSKICFTYSICWLTDNSAYFVLIICISMKILFMILLKILIFEIFSSALVWLKSP